MKTIIFISFILLLLANTCSAILSNFATGDIVIIEADNGRQWNYVDTGSRYSIQANALNPDYYSFMKIEFVGSNQIRLYSTSAGLYICLVERSGVYHLEPRSSSYDDWCSFTLNEIQANYAISLLGYNGQYVSRVSRSGIDNNIEASKSSVDSFSKFYIRNANQPRNFNFYWIKSNYGDKYCNTNPSDQSNCNADNGLQWEKWYFKQVDGGYWAIKTAMGRYLSCVDSGALQSNRDAIGAWEKFDIQRISGTNFYTIRGVNFNKYVSRQSDGSITCDRTAVGDWEKFTLYNIGWKRVAPQKLSDTKKYMYRAMVTDSSDADIYIKISGSNGFTDWLSTDTDRDDWETPYTWATWDLSGISILDTQSSLKLNRPSVCAGGSCGDAAWSSLDIGYYNGISCDTSVDCDYYLKSISCPSGHLSVSNGFGSTYYWDNTLGMCEETAEVCSLYNYWCFPCTASDVGSPHCSSYAYLYN